MCKLDQKLNEYTQQHIEFLKKQSKVLWLHQGNSSTKYSYAKMNMRRHRNKIHALLDAKGQYIYDCNNIKYAAIQFYQDLFNGDLNEDFPQVETRMRINAVGYEYLSSPITLDELNH